MPGSTCGIGRTNQAVRRKRRCYLSGSRGHGNVATLAMAIRGIERIDGPKGECKVLQEWYCEEV